MTTRVVCAGTFDHFHPGHVSFLNQAKALGSELIVIVARDKTVRRIKGITPDHDEQYRKHNVERAGIANRVVLGNEEEDIFSILHTLSPDILALGYDQRISEEKITNRFPGCRVIRLEPFHPEKFKSSFYRSER
jgi:FAD synthetase